MVILAGNIRREIVKTACGMAKPVQNQGSSGKGEVYGKRDGDENGD